MAEEKKDAWDATQWHEVKKGETLWKIAETYYGTALSIQKSSRQPGHVEGSQLDQGGAKTSNP